VSHQVLDVAYTGRPKKQGNRISEHLSIRPYQGETDGVGQ
jgi:hypothetical protein